MTVLKQSTQIKVRVGQFVDVGDGFTPETGVALSTADEAELLKANGAATVDISGATWAAITGCDGWYDLTLTTSHTDTVGELVVVVQDDSVCLPVSKTFQVVEEVVYNALYGAAATGALPVSDKTGFSLSAAGVDALWDEAGSGHLTSGSMGAALWGAIAVSGTVQTGGNYTTTLELPAAAVADDTYYDDMIVEVIGGTGVGQALFISDYVGSTQIATMNGTFATALDATSIVQVRKFGSLPGASAPSAADNAAATWNALFASHVAEGSFGSLFQAAQVGTAQSGTTTTMVLDATGASATTGFYKYALIKITGGTGAGQARAISAYNGGTVTATVDPAFTVAPDNTSTYVILDLGIDAATPATVAAATWDALRSAHITAGTFGQYVNADVTLIAGDGTTPGDLVSALDGTTPMPSNVTEVGGVAEDLPTATALATVDTNVDAILVDTDATIPGLIAALNDIAVSDILTTQMTEAYNADGTAPTLAQALFVMMQRLTESEVSGTTLTVKKLDGSTAAYTLTLDDGTNPTSETRAT